MPENAPQGFLDHRLKHHRVGAVCELLFILLIVVFEGIAAFRTSSKPCLVAIKADFKPCRILLQMLLKPVFRALSPRVSDPSLSRVSGAKVEKIDNFAAIHAKIFTFVHWNVHQKTDPDLCRAMLMEEMPELVVKDIHEISLGNW